MRPVIQTETAPGRGNCLAACVASILELDLAHVPNFRLAPDQWGALQEWLAGRGLFAVRFPAVAEHVWPMPAVPCILTGPSPRRPVPHAVVAIWDGSFANIVHDPHPEGGGLAGPAEWATFFAQLT